MSLTNNNFYKHIENNYIFEKNPKIAVAVSGGPDSMALLFLIKKISEVKRGHLSVLIVDHNLRQESKIESNNIFNYLKKQNIKSRIFSVNKKNILKKNMNEARKNRYDILSNFCLKNNILHLFIGHHKDDLLETFVSRSIMGSDFDGLKAISEITVYNKVCLIRPLIKWTKNDIYKYNKKNNIFFLEDPSNKNLKYSRSIIRKYINDSDKEIISEIKKDYNTVNKNILLFKTMLSEFLIQNIKSSSERSLTLPLDNLMRNNDIFLENIIKKIYKFFFKNTINLRSKKILILISLIKKDNFKIFNLKGMFVKKTNNSLIFLIKSN